jgi:hypothetical protein
MSSWCSPRQTLLVTEPSSAAFRAQLAQAASVVRLHPFLSDSSLVVVPEDVDQLEYDPAPIRGEGVRPVSELTHEASGDGRLARDVVTLDDHDPAADGQFIERCSQGCEVALQAVVVQLGAVGSWNAKSGAK